MHPFTLETSILACAHAAEPGHHDTGTHASDSDSAPGSDSGILGPDDTAIPSDDTGVCTKVTWYRDADGDGYGDPSESTKACTAPTGFVLDHTDCDDTHSEAYGGAVELWTDGVDDDCDGAPAHVSTTDLPVWQAIGTQSSEMLGMSVAIDGDFTGDGVPDVVLGGSAGNVDGSFRGGMVVIFAGPLGEVTTALEDGDATSTLYGALFDQGSTVCSVGDLDGDAADDLVIGHPDAEGGYSGVAYIARGPLTGTIDLSADAQAFMGASRENLGLCAAPGDVNGDGLQDVVIAASDFSGADDGMGSVYVLHGPAEQTSIDDAEQILAGTDENEFIGFHVAALGDIDGDGLHDFAVGNYQVGATSPDGLATYIVTDHDSASMHPRDAGVTVRYDLTSYGRSVLTSRVDDVNEDGYADLAFGSDSYGAADVLSLVEGPLSGTVIDLSKESETSFYSSLGGPTRMLSYAAPLGDWNANGHDAVAIGDAKFAPESALSTMDCSGSDATFCMYGALYIVAEPVEPGTHDLATVADRIEGSYQAGFLGSSLGTGGDLNGDGFPDLGFAASYATTSQSHSGAAYVLFGGGSP